jgi:hypothetical protein
VIQRGHIGYVGAGKAESIAPRRVGGGREGRVVCVWLEYVAAAGAIACAGRKLDWYVLWCVRASPLISSCACGLLRLGVKRFHRASANCLTPSRSSRWIMSDVYYGVVLRSSRGVDPARAYRLRRRRQSGVDCTSAWARAGRERAELFAYGWSMWLPQVPSPAQAENWIGMCCGASELPPLISSSCGLLRLGVKRFHRASANCLTPSRSSRWIMSDVYYGVVLRSSGG